MKPEELATIKATLKACKVVADAYGQDPGVAVELGEVLVAEIDRLHEVIEKTKKSAWQRGYECALGHVQGKYAS